MKKLAIAAIGLFLAGSAAAQIPGADSLKEKATAAAAETGGAAYLAAKAAFNKAVKDIPFAYNSAELNLDDPKYSVAGVNVSEFMKNTVIPALVKVVELAPADKQVTITGHASRKGSEEATETFQGNVALSKARAEAVVNFITANSNLPAGRFMVVAAGSSAPRSGVEPESDKNCRVSIKMD